MSCGLPLERIHAALDGELDVPATLEVERHFRECPACAAEYRRGIALRGALRDGSLRAAPPAGLAGRVRASLASGHAAPRGAGRRGLRDALALAAALLVGVALGRVLLPRGQPLPSGGADESLVAAHVRALAGGPLTQVASSDRHSVKPWFAGKLDLSPKVVDLAAEGFPLEGGRIDRTAGRPRAVLVYRHAKHVVDLFVAVAEGPPPPGVRKATVRGFHVVHWTEGDLEYTAVSDLAEPDLLAFAELVRR